MVEINLEEKVLAELGQFLSRFDNKDKYMLFGKYAKHLEQSHYEFNDFYLCSAIALSAIKKEYKGVNEKQNELNMES